MTSRAMLALAVAAVVASASSQRAQAQPAAMPAVTCELDLVLEKGLWVARGEDVDHPRLIVELKARDGQWDRLWAIALGYNNSCGQGRVRQASVDGNTVKLELQVALGNDRWTSGGYGQYAVELNRSADGQVEGKFDGSFKGRKVAGRVWGQGRQGRPTMVADYRPIQYGEHPRVLFRKHELPALKQRLASPLGQAYLALAKDWRAARGDSDIISLGMLYQLTGDKAWADETRKVVEGFQSDVNPKPAGSGSTGHRFVATAIAYDLCFDAWDEPFRGKVAADLLAAVQEAQERLHPGHANYHPCSNYYGPGHGSAGIAGLAIWGDKGPKPFDPPAPAPAAAPATSPAEEAARKEWLDTANEVHKFQREQWARDCQFWQANGGVDPVKILNAEMSRWRIYQHYRLGIGDGGFQAETGSYALIGSWYPLVYAQMHRRVFGWDVSTHPDVNLLMPRRMMQVIFQADGKQFFQKINSIAGFDVSWAAAAYPIAPDTYKPALLWAWNWATGVTDCAAGDAKLFGRKGEKAPGLAMAHTFLHYPLNGKPVPPSESMPLTWQCPDFGFYCMRSGWQNNDEFVGQVFAKAKPVMGWNHGNAGSFSLIGLGHEWVDTPESRNGARPQESVVIFPEDKLNDGGCGRVTWLKTQKDGSASMTIDLDEVYGMHGSGGWDRNLIRGQAGASDSGVRGLRAIAFDYSGKCGSPCLMVMVDKIAGGKKKNWLWQLPPELTGKPDGKKPAAAKGAPNPPAGKKVAVDGKAFVLDYGEANLRGTFVAPAQVVVEAGTENIQYGDPRHGYHGPISCVKAAGGDCFFLVATVQRGVAPAVKVAGTGLESVVAVGGQKIRFDGQKIVLGE